VYAGGTFTNAGGVAANNIAKWDGSNWSALGSGLSPGKNGEAFAYALAVSGGDVYVGGYFAAAGGIAANNIGRWDGSSWSALGSGMNGDVKALAVSGSDLYAGGYFTRADGITATNIAKWDGARWSSLGFGIGDNSSYVSTLIVSGPNLYAGGLFTTADGHGRVNSYIAKWDGIRWSALGSGINGNVSALAVSGNDLFVGGGFTIAGGKVSAFMARAYLPNLPPLSALRSGSDVMLSWPAADTADFALEQAATLAAPSSWRPNTTRITDDGMNKSVTLPATNSPQFFRLRRQ